VTVRATALAMLGRYPGKATQDALAVAVNDPEALIRHTALTQFAHAALDERQKLLTGLLYDAVKAVRMEAANQINALGPFEMASDTSAAYQEALSDYEAAMTYSADFAFGRFNLGNLYTKQKQTDKAVAQYKAAMAIDPLFYPAKVNLAMLYNSMGNNEGAEQLFREALGVRDDLSEVHYSLGLLLAEEKRYAEAAQHLAIAAKAMPRYARVHYNAGQLWDYLKEADRAQEALERAYGLEPQNPDYLKALVQHYLQHRKVAKIREMADRLLTQNPQHPVGRQLWQLADKVGQRVDGQIN
jgi:Tfp pilus assembly protein PilF